MAFNDLGPLTYLGPGQATYWWYDRGGGDYGFQAAGADVKIPSGGPIHNADLQGKNKINTGYTQYHVRITNTGSAGCWHNLQGGGAA
jgi:hypothetical protein